MQSVIDDYFATCENENRIATITGLALHLGFASRQTLINYQRKPQFDYTIARAKLRVEAITEQQLYTRDGAQGAEFTLSRNFQWLDPHKDRELNIRQREAEIKEQEAQSGKIANDHEDPLSLALRKAVEDEEACSKLGIAG